VLEQFEDAAGVSARDEVAVPWSVFLSGHEKRLRKQNKNLVWFRPFRQTVDIVPHLLECHNWDHTTNAVSSFLGNARA